MSRFLGTVLGADLLLGGGKSSHHGIQFRCTMVTESINKFVRGSIASNHGINGFFRVDYLTSNQGDTPLRKRIVGVCFRDRVDELLSSYKN